MPTVAELCTRPSSGDDSDMVECIAKLLINGVEYVPARAYFRHRINEPFSVTLSGFAKLMLNKDDKVSLEVSFDNQKTIYVVGNAFLSIMKLRQWI